MAPFYYNPDSNDSMESQWKKYLQQQSYWKDVTSTISRQTQDYSAIVALQTKEINNIIQGASKEQVTAIQEATKVVSGTLENGFELLSGNLNTISEGLDSLSSEINSMAAMLDWKFSLVIEYQKMTNLLLGNVAVLLKIPDIQKERQYHIEQGVKFYKNAIFNDNFYEDALRNFLKAEAIEPTDYFTLHRIGLIFLYSMEHLDLQKAEDYFKKAAKYATAETMPGSIPSTNHTWDSILNNNVQQFSNINAIKLAAAESYMFTGRSCYLQNKFDEAAKYAFLAFELVPQLLEAGFLHAKSLAAANNEKQAAIMLEKVINADRFFAGKTTIDLDLCTKPIILSLLIKLEKEAFEKAVNLLQASKSIIISRSVAANTLLKIEQLINKNTYLHSKQAIDLFNKVQVWRFRVPLGDESQSNQLVNIIDVINSVLKLKYYTDGDKIDREIDEKFIDAFIEKINELTPWRFPKYSTIKENDNWVNEINGKNVECNLIQFLQLERDFQDNLPSKIDKLINLHQQYAKIDANINAKKLASSTGIGILGGVGGGITGAIIGFLIMFVAAILDCFNSLVYNKTQYSEGNYIVVSAIIGGILGFIIMFNWSRKY